MVASHALPECLTVVTGGAQGFVSGDRGPAVLFPRSPFLADQDDRSRMPIDDGGMAAAGVMGSIGGNRADLLALGDLVEQFRQDRTVATDVWGKLLNADVRSGGVHGQMDLVTLAAALNAVLAGLPLSIAQELDAGAEQTIRPALGDLDS